MTRLIPKNIDIPSLRLIDRAALPDFPLSMECRLLEEDQLEPCVVLFHPQAEMHLLVRLTDLDNLPKYADDLNVALLKQAMGEPPEDEGYRIT